MPPLSRLSYRHDIDGLRGLAIGLVVVFHVFVGRVSSGVDVFLFLGGVFFFGPQFRNALDPAGRTPVQAVVRLLRRLYPALLTVVVLTLVGGLAVHSRARWSDTAQDAAASLTYRQNLHLADQGQDYAAVGLDVSMYQHLWSMAVQMQIYLAVLVVAAVVAGILRALAPETAARRGSTLLRGLLVVATVASFLWAVHLHDHDQGWNYYSPASRFWEIGLGGILGILLLNRRIPARFAGLRLPAGVLGVCAIVVTGLVLDGSAEFPGPWTLLPLAGSALVVLSGNAVEDGARPVGVTRLLGTGAFRTLGRLSYSLYLWHWPLLVLATYLFSPGPDGTAGGAATADGDTGATDAASTGGGVQGITATLGTGRGVLTGVAVIAASLALAWATHRFIETPAREVRSPERSWLPADPAVLGRNVGRGVAVVAVTATAAGTVGVLAAGPLIDRNDASHISATDPDNPDPADYPGPRALLDGVAAPEGPTLVPDVSDEDSMMPVSTTPDSCTASYADTRPVLVHGGESPESDTVDPGAPCAYGDRGSDRVLYLAGNSHSEHFLAALDTIGRQRHIKVVPLLKAGCLLGAPLPKADGEPYPECREWNEHAQRFILDNPPTDGVFINTTRPEKLDGRGPDRTPDGVVDLVRRFTAEGIHTWGMRDTPWPRSDGEVVDPRLCAADADPRESEGADPGRGGGTGGADEDCGSPRDEALSPANPALAAFDGVDADITHLDVSDALCDAERCPGVIGNVLVYRDSSHLTRTFAGMLAPEIDRQMFG
jgi:peptidoglycan/LPS O-acetylase OafA/YrhL